MLFILGAGLGAFGAWYGYDFLRGVIGKGWTIAAIVVTLLFIVVLPLVGILGAIALDVCGILELRNRKLAREEASKEGDEK